MTREEILSMNPGRELDALVAEKVMGWTEFSPIDPSCSFATGVNGYFRNFARDPEGRFTWIPFYSADMSASWEVVENIHEVGVKRFGTMKGHRYWCKIELTYDGEPIIAQGDTAPEAICKAALLAVMDE